jgi:galactitol-specific phosphotransferase system IIB component
MAKGVIDLNIVEQLCEVIEESEKMTIEVMNHLDIVLEKLDLLVDSKDLQNDIDGIKNNIFVTLESMQAQDASRQKIERVVNNLDPQNSKFADSAKHLAGDNNDDVVSDDELAALIAAANA